MPKRNLQKKIYGGYLFPTLWLTKHFNPGTNIYSEEWDTLIILDACRVDALREVSDEYDFIKNVDTRWSVGSTSKEWLINTFKNKYEEQINETALVTGNAWAEMVFEQSPDWGSWTSLTDTFWHGHPIGQIAKRNIVSHADFYEYLPVWSNTNNVENSAPRAKSVTDAAIETARNRHPEKLIVHYMQPHEPFFHDSGPEESLSKKDKKPMDVLRADGNKNEIWGRYIDNLRYVLDSVKLLLENHNAGKVIITADHGELFGELGLHGHLAAFPHPNLRRVPWVKTEAKDEESYRPERRFSDFKDTSGNVQERLKDLGYV
ncbi:hypothetical protein JZX76_05420 [Haloarcula hispanica]|uniref:PglZ domain-containing protein n=1 Tax=Haloarcula hispanica TaxID=51589 RepID=A0A482TBX3_HALHI|nr:PglZ domain-containing protein [Haloarcula hispanica]MCJ0618976.1 hypothetical protein [Haloarcula hispanica]RYJ09509.1 PglZ domain-containing protein [Haloarcula hispanica]